MISVVITHPSGEEQELSEMDFKSIERHTQSGNLVALTINYDRFTSETIPGAEINRIVSDSGQKSGGQMEH